MEHTTAATAASKTAHTPGPWLVKGRQSVRGSAGEYIAKANWNNGEANARLIAAAPDLLIALREAEAALEVAVGRLLNRQPDYPVHVTSEHLGLVLVRSAIAQATGSAA